MPQQSLAGRNRHNIEAGKLDITFLAQPDAPGQSRVQSPSIFRKQTNAQKSRGGMSALGRITVCSMPQSICPNIQIQMPDYQQLVEMFQTGGKWPGKWSTTLPDRVTQGGSCVVASAISLLLIHQMPVRTP